jgi:hypothetical protein
MRSFIQRRLGSSKYTAGVHGSSRSELRGVYAAQPVPRSCGLIDDVKSDCGKSSTIELTVVPENGVFGNFQANPLPFRNGQEIGKRKRHQHFPETTR